MLRYFALRRIPTGLSPVQVLGSRVRGDDDLTGLAEHQGLAPVGAARLTMPGISVRAFSGQSNGLPGQMPKLTVSRLSQARRMACQRKGGGMNPVSRRCARSAGAFIQLTIQLMPRPRTRAAATSAG